MWHASSIQGRPLSYLNHNTYVAGIICVAFMSLTLAAIGVWSDTLAWILLSMIGLAGMIFLVAVAQPYVVMLVYFVISFVIYIPVSILRSEYPLLIQDIIIGIALMQTFVLHRKGPLRLLGGSHIVKASLGLYIGSVTMALISDNIASLTSAVQGLRTLTFGIGFLLLSSAWMNSRRAVDGFLRIYLLGAVFAALYGLRQFVFGLAPFELDRLAVAGSVLDEIKYLGRIRIPSSFGVPPAFAFVMLTAILLVPISQSRLKLPTAIRRAYPLVLSLLLFIGLLISLMRGPLLAMLVAIAFFSITQRRHVFARFGLVFLMAIVVLALGQVGATVEPDKLDNKILRGVANIIESVWTVMPFHGDPLRERQSMLASLPITYRLQYSKEVVAFLISHPLGGGVGTVTTGQARYLHLPSIDIGYLRLAAEIGWPGLLAFLSLFLSVPWVAYWRLRMISDRYTVTLGHRLLALWIGYAVLLATNPYLETEIISAAVWTLGGILLNLDIIAADGSLEKRVFME